MDTNSTPQLASNNPQQTTTSPTLTSSPGNLSPLPLKVFSLQLKTRLGYLLSMTFALVLVITCPNTRLWKSDDPNKAFDQSANNLNPDALASLIVTWLLAVIAYFALQGSDPGYIEPWHVEKLNELESEGLLSNHDDEEDDLNEFIDDDIDENINDNTTETSDNNSVELTSIRQRPPLDSSGHSTWHGDRSLHSSNLYKSTRRKQCKTCAFAPPLRAHHCKICDRCVSTFDHHCTFLSTCIGERNRCRFLAYCLFQSITCFTSIQIINTGHIPLRLLPSNASYLEKNGMWLMTSMYVWPLFLFSTVMLLVHCFFAVSNVTTFECANGGRNTEDPWKKIGNSESEGEASEADGRIGEERGGVDYLSGTKECDLPFSKGIMANLRLFCCTLDKSFGLFTSCLSVTSSKGYGKTREEKDADSWLPRVWKTPSRIVRDSEDFMEHPWENKYYSCC